jgi:hypothetical protein
MVQRQDTSSVAESSYVIGRNGRPLKDYGTAVCQYPPCGITFKLDKYSSRPGRGRFHSQECAMTNGWKKPAQEHYNEVVDKSGGPNACWPIKGVPNGSGYVQMDAGDRLPNGTYRRIGVHQWALEQKLGRKLSQRSPGKKGEVTRHTCHNSLCGNPDHVVVGSQKNNIEDTRIAGRRGRTGPPGGQLNEDAVRAIRDKYAAGGITQMELSRQYGVVQPVISQVIRREIWRHVG